MDSYLHLEILEHFVNAVEEESNSDAWKGGRSITKDKVSHTYVPLPVYTFVKALRKIQQCWDRKRNHHYKKTGEYLSKPRFIDAGCGLGVKLVIAEGMGCDVSGIEIDRKLINRAKRIFKSDRLNIKCQDILKHDYSTYDIIYFYRPFYDPKKQTEFEKRIQSQMKKGAYLMGFDSVTCPPEKQFSMLHNDPYVFYRRK